MQTGSAGDGLGGNGTAGGEGAVGGGGGAGLQDLGFGMGFGLGLGDGAHDWSDGTGFDLFDGFFFGPGGTGGV